MRDLKNEANILFKLRGPHVVGLLGVTNQEPLCLVMEFLEKGNILGSIISYFPFYFKPKCFNLGSLYDYLQSKEKIEWNQRNEFIFEIAQGRVTIESMQSLNFIKFLM